MLSLSLQSTSGRLCAASAALCFALGVSSCSADDPHADEPQFAAASSTTEAGSNSIEATPQDTGAKAECSPEEFAKSGNVPAHSIAVEYCDGRWALIGQAQTSNFAWLRAIDGQWDVIESIGTAGDAMPLPCYDVDKYLAEGAPKYVKDNMQRCD
jgi:hypothetical protein